MVGRGVGVVQSDITSRHAVMPFSSLSLSPSYTAQEAQERLVAVTFKAGAVSIRDTHRAELPNHYNALQ